MIVATLEIHAMAHVERTPSSRSSRNAIAERVPVCEHCLARADTCGGEGCLAMPILATGCACSAGSHLVGAQIAERHGVPLFDRFRMRPGARRTEVLDASRALGL